MEKIIGKKFIVYATHTKDLINFKYVGLIHPDAPKSLFGTLYGGIFKVQIEIIDMYNESTADWESDEWWGIYDNDSLSLIYQNLKVFNTCFPYGIDKISRGIAVKLKIEKL